MQRNQTVTICGGGSQGHISAGVIGSNSKYRVNVLTRRPQRWSKDFKTVDLEGKEFSARLHKISSDPSDVIPESDIVLIALPGYAIREELEKISGYVRKDAVIGCVFGGSGFFLAARQVFGKDVRAFALQRVPFTGRVMEYGHSGRLKGYKPYLKVGFNNISPEECEGIVRMLEDWYHTPVYRLSHWLEATLSNSNPLLHPCRMYVMFKDWSETKVYDRVPYMYNTDWDDESSQCWVDCDNELREVLKRLPVCTEEIPSILDYYESPDVASLTRKMQSIEPFKTVKAHMIETPDGYKIDPTVRYFTEDVPFGILLIKAYAEKTGVCTPTIDKVIYWAQRVMGKEYLVEGKLSGRDMNEALRIE
ncbi:MAG: NAD/NADP octopine/nopaline dehydrogenase family protein [Muribaculum sp.]|nr:NAD/NADP octopine/nopaline dehydrogenase family protein [Muribaculum sp.]